MSTIFSKMLASQKTNEFEVGKKLNKRAGTIEFHLTAIEWDNPDRKYDIFNISTNWGSLNMIKDDSNNLIFTIVLNDLGTFTVSGYVGNFIKGSRHHVAITWSIDSKEIKLYLDGQPVSTTQILKTKS